jgi:hypothetical protein
LFACQFKHKRTICIQEQFLDRHLNTKFIDIYKIRINQLTLRELMFMQSIYSSKTQSDIEKLVLDQPTPSIFYKISLDLGIKSLINYISFDSKSMRSLLSEDNSAYFNSEFPLFFKNESGRSEIDTALDHNQIRSVNMMINYVVKF